MLLEHTQELLASPVAAAAADAVQSSVGVYVGCMYTGEVWQGPPAAAVVVVPVLMPVVGLQSPLELLFRLLVQALIELLCHWCRVSGWRPCACWRGRRQLQRHCRARSVLPGRAHILHLRLPGVTFA